MEGAKVVDHKNRTPLLHMNHFFVEKPQVYQNFSKQFGRFNAVIHKE